MGIFSGGGGINFHPKHLGGAIKIQLTTPAKKAQHTIMLFVCHPQIFSLVSLEAILTAKRNQRQFLCKILERQKKEHYGMLGYFLELSIGTLYKGGAT